MITIHREGISGLQVGDMEGRRTFGAGSWDCHSAAV